MVVRYEMRHWTPSQTGDGGYWFTRYRGHDLDAVRRASAEWRRQNPTVEFCYVKITEELVAIPAQSGLSSDEAAR